ncbi:hypothetical protein [Nocardia brasiliensis]|uniref:hypothetical protein n=1 Tax=Nocardia brasiliensis TaxID=37326 RepID=UPI00245628CF|nr:hypothetical protein [Nocardia brasiliensis]
MTNTRETLARSKLLALGIVIDAVATAIIFGWWLMAATGHSDGDVRVLTLGVLALLALTVIAWWRWRTAKRRAFSQSDSEVA